MNLEKVIERHGFDPSQLTLQELWEIAKRLGYEKLSDFVKELEETE